MNFGICKFSILFFVSLIGTLFTAEKQMEHTRKGFIPSEDPEILDWTGIKPAVFGSDPLRYDSNRDMMYIPRSQQSSSLPSTKENYTQYLDDPKLIMQLSITQREDVTARIKCYLEVVLNPEEIRKIIGETDGTLAALNKEAAKEKLAIATFLHNFYLDLQFKGQERSQALIDKREELMQAFQGILSAVGERKEAARLAYLELDAKIRRAERSIFGAIKDAFVGRDIPPAPVDPSVRMIEEELQQNMTATVAYLDGQIESWCRQNEQTALSLDRIAADIQLIVQLS